MMSRGKKILEKALLLIEESSNKIINDVDCEKPTGATFHNLQNYNYFEEDNTEKKNSKEISVYQENLASCSSSIPAANSDGNMCLRKTARQYYEHFDVSSGNSSDEYEPNISDISSDDELNSVDVKVHKKKKKTPQQLETDIQNKTGVDERVIFREISEQKETTEISNKKKKKIFPIKEYVSRKRLKNPDSWKRNAAALAREKGLAYISQTGKQVLEKCPNLGILCNEKCRFNCSEKFNNEQRQKIFSSFYKMDVNSKNAFLFSCIVLKEVQRMRKGARKHKNASYQYQVICDRKITRVCKTALCSLYQIGRKKIDYLQNSIKTGHASPMPDRRGKHENRPHKIATAVSDYVTNHIKLFPSEESHYSRNKNINKKYLSPLLSVQKMHELYLQKCDEEKKPTCYKIKQCSYRRIFETKFNLSFGHPRSDTCSTCDAGQKNEEHVENYHLAFDLQRNDRQTALTDENMVYLTVDLQQTMPLPRLTTSKAFYLRQMWFYNLGVHTITSNINRANFFTWTENVANRGSTEVASSLLTLFEFDETLKGKDHLVIWSDSCGGQNKNFFLISLYQMLILKGYFKTIDHKFPEVGHSYLDSDRDFGRIEKVLRKYEQILLPEQYREIICKASKGNRVTDMTQHFRKFEELPNILHLVNTKKNTLKKKIFFRDKIKWIRVDEFGYYLYKHTYDEYTPFLQVCILKRPTEMNPNDVSLERCEHFGILSEKKMENLQEQIPFIKEECRYFYKKIIEENKKKIIEENKKKAKKNSGKNGTKMARKKKK